MKTFNINIDANIQEQLNLVAGQVLPNTKLAFQQIVYGIQGQWKDWATGNTLPGIMNNPFPSTRIRNSIKTTFTGNWSATIYSNDKQMDSIERGTPEFDMKTKYPYGKKSRVSKNKDGSIRSSYLIIPFRWGTPTGIKDGSGNDVGRAHFRGRVIPDYLYEVVKKYDKSLRTDNVHNEENYHGEQIQRAEYEWGNRVSKGDTDIPEAIGMVRMSGKGGYFTFRIISSLSKKGWVRQAKPPIPLTDFLVSANQQKANEILSMALAKDIQNLL